MDQAWWNSAQFAGGSISFGSSRPSGPRLDASGQNLWTKYDGDISGYEQSDVDLFLYGLDAAAARAKIKHIYCTLARNWAPHHISIVRTQNVITFAAQWPFRRVQIILRLYSGPAEVLMGFDIDSCCVAYDGTSVSCLPRWRRAVNGSFNLVDPARRSPSYELRLSKYALRGFAVAVPAFDPKRLDGSLVTMEPGETDGLARLLIHAQDDAMNAEHVPRAFSKFGSRLPKDATGKGTTQWAPAIFRGRVECRRLQLRGCGRADDASLCSSWLRMIQMSIRRRESINICSSRLDRSETVLPYRSWPVRASTMCSAGL